MRSTLEDIAVMAASAWAAAHASNTKDAAEFGARVRQVYEHAMQPPKSDENRAGRETSGARLADVLAHGERRV